MFKTSLAKLRGGLCIAGVSLRSLVNSKWTGTLLTVISLFFIFKAGYGLLADFQILPNFFSPWFVAASLLALVYRIVNPYGWVLSLRAMDQDVNGVDAAKIWIQSESRRWLPGGIWSYASRAAQANRLNVSAATASASMMLELILTCASAAIIVAMTHNRMKAIVLARRKNKPHSKSV